MKVCVVDTTVASLMLNDRPQLSPYQPHLLGASVYISFQTVAEMRFGALNKRWGIRRKQQLETFLAPFTIIGYTDALADCWAIIMQEARQAGRRLETGDGWIAATALLLNAPLLTHDKDFDAQACPSIAVICYAA